MPETPIKTTTDAYADEARPSGNFGQSAYIWLSATASNQRQGFVFFREPFPLGATVFEALLTVHLAGAGGWPGSNTITAERITEPWGENGLRWSNRPAISTLHSATASITGGAAGDALVFTITDMIQDVADGDPFYGIRLRIGTSALRALVAAEHPNQGLRALLEIDWSRTPLAPQPKAPTGGLAVSVTRPVLDWQFDSDDHSAERRQAYSQVQVSTSTDFSSPSYDSGKVANLKSSWDLSLASSPSFSALADDAVRWWRVKVWDDKNQVSDWSDAVQFQRKSKGTLTISNPPVAPGNVVNEITPPIVSALASRTQEAVQIVLYQLDGTRQIVKWNAGKVVTADESIELPANRLKTGEQFRVLVRKWDTIDRAVTQGDPDFVQLTRDFTYVRAGTIASVTNLSAVQFGPGIVLTWHRTAAPLWFCLKVNGVEVMDRIDPDDVHVSGDTYSMTYYGAVSGDANTYEVEAVEQPGTGPYVGKLVHSSGNDDVTVTANITAKWLVDDDLTDGSVVEIMGREQAGFKRAKSATVYKAVGAPGSSEIIDSIGGDEGPISGLLADTAAKEKLEAMFHKAKPLRFIQSTMNIPVEIRGEPNINPASDHIGDVYTVSVELAQVAEFPEIPAT